MTNKKRRQVALGTIMGHTTHCSRPLWCWQVWVRSKTLTSLVFCLFVCFLNLYLLQWFCPQHLKFTQRFRCLSDKDLKTCHFIARKSKNLFFFSWNANYAGITLSLFVDVSNNISTSIRPACRDYHWTFLLITIETIKVWVYYLHPCRNTYC